MVHGHCWVKVLTRASSALCVLVVSSGYTEDTWDMGGEHGQNTWAFEDTSPAKTFLGAKRRPKTLPEHIDTSKSEAMWV